MSIGRAALLRPIEITSTSDSFTATISGFAGVNITVENGTYASILTLAYGLFSSGSSYTVAFSTSGSTAGRITISNASNFSITWTDTELRDILGFTGNLTGSNTYTATYKPKYTWISDYTPRDREWWQLRHRETYSGTIARNGELVGAATGNQIYYRELSFEAESGANMLKSLCASADPQARTLEALIEGARSSAPSDATNAPTHGLWFVYDIADLEPLATMASSNGIRAHYDKWQWCHLDPVGMRPPKPSFGTGRDFWSTEIELHTADAPTWDAPTPPS